MKYFPIMLVAFSTIFTAVNAAAPVVSSGGPVRAWNYSTNSFEMVPQCFPWTFSSNFRLGNIGDIYENQSICRKNREVDFR